MQGRGGDKVGVISAAATQRMIGTLTGAKIAATAQYNLNMNENLICEGSNTEAHNLLKVDSENDG